MIDIEQLFPEYITAYLGNMSFVGEKLGNKYLIKEVVNDRIDVDEVDIYINDRLFDKVKRSISLRPGDTLELEYSIDAIE